MYKLGRLQNCLKQVIRLFMNQVLLHMKIPTNRAPTHSALPLRVAKTDKK
jgi:hypothetical protein